MTTTLIPAPRPPLPAPRPAALGFTCDAWNRNPNPDGPYLRRCCRRATVRLTLQTPTDYYDVKRCPACADELRRKAANGAIFKILAEVEIG